MGWILLTVFSELAREKISVWDFNLFLLLSTSLVSGLSGPEENIPLQQTFQAHARKVL